MFEQIINVDRMEQAVSLFGSFDENIKLLEKTFNVKIHSRGSDIKVTGEAEDVAKGVKAINGLLMLINRGEVLNEQNVRYVISLVGDGNEDKLSTMSNDCICITSKGKPIKPKTLGQKKYVEAIKQNTIVLGVGPAGTGKSWLATALGHQACMLGFKVRYFHVFKLFEEITNNRIEGTLSKFFKKLADTDLLIIDDFGV